MENLTPTENNPTKTENDKTTIEGILQAVKTAFDATNTTASKDVLLAVTQCVMNAIKANYRGLTLDELREAINRGAGGWYGIVLKLNASVIVGWIDKFWTETAEMRVARARLNRKAITQTATKTTAEIEASREQLCNILFDDYCKGREPLFDRCAAIVFDWLWTTNQFRPSREHCADVLARVQLDNNKNLSIFQRAVGKDSEQRQKENKAKKILVFEFFERKKNEKKTTKK